MRLMTIDCKMQPICGKMMRISASLSSCMCHLQSQCAPRYGLCPLMHAVSGLLCNIVMISDQRSFHAHNNIRAEHVQHEPGSVTMFCDNVQAASWLESLSFQTDPWLAIHQIIYLVRVEHCTGCCRRGRELTCHHHWPHCA